MNRKNLIGCMALALGACTSAPKEYKLTGTLEGIADGYVLVGHGPNSVVTADTVRIAPDGTFSYSILLEKPEAGFMYVPGKAFYSLLMINGTETTLTASPDTPDQYAFTGDLEEAYRFRDAVSRTLREKCAASYPSFGAMQTTFATLSDSIGQAAGKISPEAFAALMAEEVEMNAGSTMLDYRERLASAGQALDSDADYNRYMEGLDKGRADLAMAYVRWKEACVNPGNPPSYLRMLATVGEKVTDPEVREKVTLDLMAGYFCRCDSDLEKVYEQALPMMQDEKRREWLTQVYEANKKLVPGSDAIDCRLESIDGTELNLSSLYGKVLYIDVWATWCGPCCEEIPYMEKLAEHFKDDSRILPVSISVDRNKKAWTEKLKADRPQWKQYLCPDFTDLYGITGIPCFILIDRNGKIITAQAPRPSEPECIGFIEGYLK